ncbi:MAG: nitroreductase family protein [Promethearchaeota archaeon]
MNVKEAIEKRRAYRSLDPIEITDDLINDLAKCIQLAPSCMNKQPWRVIFIKDKQILQELFTTYSEGNQWAKRASMVIAVFSNKRNDCIIGERLYYLFDTAMAVAFIQLRATELGLVAHPIAGFNDEKAKKILKIPEKNQLICLINIGKHSTDVNPNLSDNMKLGEKNRPPRKPLKRIAYINQYGESLNE